MWEIEQVRPPLWRTMNQNATVFHDNWSVWSFSDAPAARYAGSFGPHGNFVLESLQQTSPVYELLDIRSTSGTEEGSVPIALSCKTCPQPRAIMNGHWRTITPTLHEARDRPEPPIVE